jgi:hypothetical protein
MSSKLALDGRVVVVTSPTEPHLPPGRVFRVVPLDDTQEPRAQTVPKRRGTARLKQAGQ